MPPYVLIFKGQKIPVPRGKVSRFYEDGRLQYDIVSGDVYYPNGRLALNGKTNDEYYEDGSVKTYAQLNQQYSQSGSRLAG